jgi:hypothetical protein
MRKSGVANTVCYVKRSYGKDTSYLGLPVFVVPWYR